MAIKPYSIINICNVDFDITCKHQRVFFEDGSDTWSSAKQIQWFVSRAIPELSFTEYVTVREQLPDGGTVSAIKVGKSVDELKLKGANYMYYQNGNLSDKIFFAFITDIVYVNEGTSKIYFETDVFQTWIGEAILKPSFIERCHSATDEIGGNVVPENFSYEDFCYHELNIEGDKFNDGWGYLIGCSNNIYSSEELELNKIYSGIYQGMYFYYFDQQLLGDETSTIKKFLEKALTLEGDVIQFITVIPKFIISNAYVDEKGEVSGTYAPANFDYTLNVKETIEYHKYYNGHYKTIFNGYNPKNNKLYTNPFCNVVVSNHSADEAIYNIEDWSTNNPCFYLEGDISPSPSCVLYPNQYKGVVLNYDAGITINKFPQCSFTTDMYKLWLTKNQHSLRIAKEKMQSGIVTSGIGATASVLSGNIGGGVNQALQGAQNAYFATQDIMNMQYQASYEPNKLNKGESTVNLLTAIEMNKFSFYIRTLKRDYAEAVDNFFTIFGYAVKKLQLPNMKQRTHYTYIKTVDCNIVSNSIPADDIVKLKSVFNNGCTFWQSNCDVADYSVDNKPILEV